MANQNEDLLQLEYRRMKKEINGLVRRINARKEDQNRLQEELSAMLENLKNQQRLIEDKSIRLKESSLPAKYLIQLTMGLGTAGAPSTNVCSVCGGTENKPAPFQKQPRNGAIARGGRKSCSRIIQERDLPNNHTWQTVRDRIHQYGDIELIDMISRISFN